MEALRTEHAFQTLADKVAIVTGGSRGIGAAIALELARRGAKVGRSKTKTGTCIITNEKVAITYTSSSSTKLVESLIEQIHEFHPSSAIGVQADLREVSSPQRIVQKVLQDLHTAHIDILVNNAGVEMVKPFHEVTSDDFALVFETNVRAPLLMMQAVHPYLRAPGRVINIGSVGSRHGFRDLSAYCASKSALEGMTRCWATELGGAGHTVNTVNPGPVETEMIWKIPKEIVKMQMDQTPVENRMAKVGDVTQIVAWLAGGESGWVTGQAICASGGWAMY
ncbi:hypothetical protein ASPZODRAFT_129478 [Penicilliopsis zonata CBS 506.65]|uniref:Uncharacterized protein n=1 Tax=Penicilliopsis zonata CBS 506.65 TaxID=1073090 RepID=A0A1L9SPT8_9EURO|nr:hypothetical protein ASPZODRAFT_129478 [Penicilliopsis zonata CBS 506.65]OJJ49084.1 hypothetical protein ASPZODRAFT_129478 [Penicilliopsis zonata CBS 506.65]